MKQINWRPNETHMTPQGETPFHSDLKELEDLDIEELEDVENSESLLEAMGLLGSSSHNGS